MTNREFYLQRQEVEWPMFSNVLKALPADRLDYKPHERSQSAEQIAQMISSEFAICVNVVTERKGEWKVAPNQTLEEMTATFENAMKALKGGVARLDDTAWDQTAKFYYQGKMVSEQPISQFLWMILFDGVHHRGQLTTYLRPMGGKVPAIYGPSADTRS